MQRLSSVPKFLGTKSRFWSTHHASATCAVDPCKDVSTDKRSPEIPVIVGDTNISCKTVVLNRPRVLNAVNTIVGTQLLHLCKSWKEDPNVTSVLVKGSGHAFCAGGDVVEAYHMINEGRLDDCKEFFQTVYRLLYFIASYSKPQVAILNGITMGGGSGISVLGRFRVVTDKTIYATPEILIGFHPDGAASYYLSRLNGYLGEYLALTGDTLNGAEMLACGLATHYTSSTRIAQLEEKLAQLKNTDASAIRTLLDSFSETPCLGDQSILQRTTIINECFRGESVEDIFAALESKGKGVDNEWCNTTLKKLKAVAPLSLKISLKSIREGRFQTLEQCIMREYRMTVRAIEGKYRNNFLEGIRTRLVDKTFSPKWEPSTLDQVSQDMVNQYFSPLSPTEPDIELPIEKNQCSVDQSLRREKHATTEEEGKEPVSMNEILSRARKLTKPNFQKKLFGSWEAKL